MASTNIQTVTLSGYSATVDGANYLCLGTWDSYGIEQLQINPGPEWAGLVIKATFNTSAGATPVVVPAEWPHRRPAGSNGPGADGRRSRPAGIFRHD